MEGEFGGYRMRKRATLNAFTHSRICAEAPPAGREPATLTPVARALTQLTKCSDETPQVLRS